MTVEELIQDVAKVHPGGAAALRLAVEQRDGIKALADNCGISVSGKSLLDADLLKAAEEANK